MIRLSGPPDGWRTNFKKLKSNTADCASDSDARYLHRVTPTSFRLSIKLNPGQYKVILPFLPLEPALGAVQAYHNSNPATRFLMDLHFGAIDQLGTESQLFLFAKALELARVMLPGRKDPQKEAALSPGVRAALSVDLSTGCSTFQIIASKFGTPLPKAGIFCQN